MHPSLSRWTRRGLVLAALAVAACGNTSGNRNELDARVDSALNELFTTVSHL